MSRRWPLFWMIPMSLLVLSCDKSMELDSKPPTLGKQVAVTEVIEAIEAAIGESTPLDLQIGDKVFSEYNQKVELSAVRVINYTQMEVIDRYDLEEENKVRFVVRTTQITPPQGGEPEKIVMKDTTVDIEKPEEEGQTAHFAKVGLNSLIQPLDDEVTHTTYHNLKVKPVTIQFPDCGSGACTISATEIRFEQAAWNKSGQFDKIEYLLVLSPNVPWFSLDQNFSNIVTSCRNGLVKTSVRKYFANECVVLRSFKSH